MTRKFSSLALLLGLTAAAEPSRPVFGPLPPPCDEPKGCQRRKHHKTEAQKAKAAKRKQRKKSRGW